MNEVGVNIRVQEEFSSVIPRVVQNVDRMGESLKSALDDVNKVNEAFKEWNEQLRAVNTAQAVNQATRPINQSKNNALDPNGRNMQGVSNQASLALIDMKRIMEDLVDTMKEVAGQLEKTSGAGVPAENAGGGSVEAQQAGGKKKKIISDQEKAGAQDASGMGIDKYRKMRGLGGVLSSLAGGDVVGSATQAGGSIIDTLSSGWAGLSGGSKAGLIGAAGALGIAVGGNALSKQYESSMGKAMDLTGQLGRYDSKYYDYDNSFAIRKTMQGVSQASALSGYSFEQGGGVVSAMLRAGSNQGSAMGDLSSTLRYSRALGLSPEELAKYKGIENKTGNRNLYGLALGGAESTGIGSARMLEELESITSVLEDGFSKGIKVDAQETSKALNWLAQGGSVWQGAGGGNMWNQIRGATERATGLQDESNVLLFRAAKAGGKSDLEAMKALENPDVGLMKNAWKEISGLTGGNKMDSIMMLKQTFGLNYTGSEKMFDLMSKGDWGKAAASSKEVGNADSTEKRNLAAMEGLAQDIRQFGVPFFEGKTAFMETVKKAADGMITVFGLDLSKSNAQKDAELRAEEAKRTQTTIGRGQSEVAARIGSGDADLLKSTRGKNPKAFDILDRISNGLPSDEMVLTQQDNGMIPEGTTSKLALIRGLLTGKGNKYTELLGSSVGENQAINNILKKGNAFESPVTPKEVSVLLDELIKVLKDNTTATAAQTKAGVTVKAAAPQPATKATGATK